MRATLLHVEWRQPANASDWQRWARLAGMDGLTVDEGPRFSSDDHALQAAVAGHGVANGSLSLARPEIEAGLLGHPFGQAILGEGWEGRRLGEEWIVPCGTRWSAVR